MKKKSLICIVLAILILVPMVLGGCSQQKANTGSESEQKGKQAEAKTDTKTETKTEELKSLDITVRNWVNVDHYDTIVQKKWEEMMEEYMGMKLNITWVNVPYRDYTEVTKVYQAAGQFHDIFIAIDQYQIQELGDNGLLVNLMDYKDQLKYYQDWLDDNYNFERISTAEGKVYGFATGEIGYHTGNQQNFAYRFDIFQKHNLKIPETQNEFFEVCKKLKELYPDSYPIGGGWPGGDYNLYTVFLMINRTYYSFYYNGEKYVYGPVDDEERFKATMEYLAKLYKAGLIDPEVFTMSRDQSLEYMTTGRNFVAPNFFMGEFSRFNNNAEHPDLLWGAAPRPLGYKGEVGWKPASQWKGYKLIPDNQNVISSKAKHPELLVKMLDYQYSPEMVELSNWGVEGVTFTRESDGTKKYVDAITKAASPRAEADKFGIQTGANTFAGIRMPKDRPAWSAVFPSVPVFADGRYFDYPDIWKFTYDYEHQEESVYPDEIAPPIRLNAEERNLRSNIKTPLDTYVKEYIVGFITGDIDLSEYDKFKNSLKNVGDYTQLLDMLNQKLAEFNK